LVQSAFPLPFIYFPSLQLPLTKSNHDYHYYTLRIFAQEYFFDNQLNQVYHIDIAQFLSQTTYHSSTQNVVSASHNVTQHDFNSEAERNKKKDEIFQILKRNTFIIHFDLLIFYELPIIL